jgi:hypothetical protein
MTCAEPGAEQRFTLDEASREIARRRCAAEGHRPDIHIASMEDPVGIYLCECHAVHWTSGQQHN